MAHGSFNMQLKLTPDGGEAGYVCVPQISVGKWFEVQV